MSTERHRIGPRKWTSKCFLLTSAKVLISGTFPSGFNVCQCKNVFRLRVNLVRSSRYWTPNASLGHSGMNVLEDSMEQSSHDTTASLRNIEILYQTERWIAVNKPAGMLVHRTRLYPSARGEKFLVDVVRTELTNKLERRLRIFPVHRLDRPTTGVILFGLDEPRNAAMLQEALQSPTTSKQYWTLAFGANMPEKWVNEHPLKDLKGRNRKQRPARTEFERLVSFQMPDIAVVRATISSGRRHQIRRHLSNSRYPVVGDTTHGDAARNNTATTTYGISRLCLHARRLNFTDPFTLKSIYLHVPVPEDLCKSLQRFPGYTYELDGLLDLRDPATE